MRPVLCRQAWGRAHSRPRRLIDLETHRAVFTWMVQVLASARGPRQRQDDRYRCDNAAGERALRSIVRRTRARRGTNDAAEPGLVSGGIQSAVRLGFRLLASEASRKRCPLARFTFRIAGRR